jgi:hypothetical protein
MDKNIKRNVPADEGRRNDPHVRDESAAQPGVNTMSSAPNDEANEELTKTASENFDTEGRSNTGKPDPKFDEIDNEDI